jgi:hypothetical protein
MSAAARGGSVNFEPVYVIGGRQRRPRGLAENGDTWYGYGSGLILRVDPHGVDVVLEYVSPAGACLPDDPILFKSATRLGDTLYCTTQTELIVYDVPSFSQIGYVSLPVFNDVHHVIPWIGDTLLVANSGLESVMQVNLDGELLEVWNVLGEDMWSVFDRHVDYRLGVELKPHRGHPNHLLAVDGEVWVSRFELRDLAPLSNLEQPIDLGGERVHDGVMHDGHAFLTMVDGHVVEVDLGERVVVARHSLQPDEEPDRLLGWCRGLHFVEGNRCWVGFSRIRKTKLRQTVQWVKNRGVIDAPTRIDLYDTTNWSVVHSVDLEPYGLNAVFSVIPVGPIPSDLSHVLYG